MLIERATSATPELVEALGRLIPQLGAAMAPSAEEIAQVIAAPGSTVLVARDDDGTIRGTLTLVVHRKLLGDVMWLEDVVVDEAARGRGYGAALVRAAEASALARGVHQVRLTSRDHREAAHRLYERLGFDRHQTRVYRKDLA